MRTAWAALAAIAAGVLLGVGSAAAVLAGARFGGGSWSGWTGDPRVGSPAADPWTRATVAKAGLLALTRSQTIYFTRYADDGGRPLNGACAYKLLGGPMPARWWSVTIYAADDYLPRGTGGPLSVDATRPHLGPGGAWTARVGPQAGPGPGGAAEWIGSRGAGRFSLTLRLYNPTAQAAADFGSIAFPRVQRIGCPAGGAA